MRQFPSLERKFDHLSFADEKKDKSEKTSSVKRHTDWIRLEKAFLYKNPRCVICKSKQRLQVHHKIPLEIDRSKELELSNLVSLCERCHLFVGHLGLWNSWNPDVEKDIEIWKNKFNKRPKYDKIKK
jgi:5-methylcytosine-specific restriction endonuclease McrA